MALALITTNATEYVGNPFLLIKFAAIGLGVLNVIAMQFLPAWRRRAAEPPVARERRGARGRRRYVARVLARPPSRPGA